MKRTLIAVVAVLGFAVSANAASIAISTDKASYITGETITVTVDLAIADGESASGAIVTLGFGSGDTGTVSGESVDTGAAQITSFGGSAGWTVAALQGQCDAPGLCRLVDQIAPNPTGAAVGPAYASSVVLTFLAGNAGTIDFTTAVNNFFGAANANASVTIVPEPTTAALLGLGLFGLALGGRRRS
ncbi:MAG: PEP-CTERM sorting domain-containing protein [Myxococcota bacterium]